MDNVIETFKSLDGKRFLDDNGRYVYPGLVQIYMDVGRYSHPLRICGVYADLYLNGDTRVVYAESGNGLPYRAELKVGTLDKSGYFHFSLDEKKGV